MGRDAEVRGGLRTSASPRRTRRGGGDRGDRGDRGAATAEAMVVLPVVLAVGLGLVWLLGLAVAQVRVVDGAREAARVAARGDGAAAARDAARRVAPAGSSVSVGRRGGSVVVVVTADVAGPGGLFRLLPAVTLRSTATAVEEPT